MKRTWSKFTASMLALVMVLALMSPAFVSAADDTEDTEESTTTTYSLSIKSVETGETEHVYAVYQIFKGTVVTETLTTGEGDSAETAYTYRLANITAGQNMAEAYKSDVLAAANAIMQASATAGTTTDEDGESTTTYTAVTDATLLETIAKYVSMGEGTTPYAVMKGGETVSLEPGYYLVVDLGLTAESNTSGVKSVYGSIVNGDSNKSSTNPYYYTPLYGDTDSTSTADESYSLYIAVLMTENHTNVSRKTDEPGVTKEVLEAESDSGETSGTGDSDEENSSDETSSGESSETSSEDSGSSDDSDSIPDGSWAQAADYDIGDTVYFRLTATMPDATSYGYYDSYVLEFNDTLSSGLSLKSTTSDGATTYSFDYIKVEVVNTTSSTDENETTSASSSTTVLTDLTDKTSSETNDTADIPGYVYTITKNNDGTTSVVIKIGYWDIDGGESNSGGFVEDTKGITAITDNYTSCQIVVTYSATLNSSATVGSTGNKNTVSLTYSNDPNTAAATTTSTEDEAYVLTYQLTIYKVEKSDGSTSDILNTTTVTHTDSDGSTTTTTTTSYSDGTGTVTITTTDSSGNTISTKTYKSLTGASFTLYKYYADGYTVTTTDEDGNETASTEYWKSVGTLPSDSSATSTFTWSGLDEGYYKLVETTTPNGYLAMDDLYFQISSTVAEGTDGASITALSAVEVTATAGENGEYTFTSTDNDTTVSILSASTDTNNALTGTLTGYIVNESGLELPTTGALGLVILVAAAAVILVAAVVVRRRTGHTDVEE